MAPISQITLVVEKMYPTIASKIISKIPIAARPIGTLFKSLPRRLRRASLIIEQIVS